jgi:16S rRNA (guanine966-N2)-methyltransferase
MRIISGYLGGRQFDSPNAKRTHPMSDRVRGGLFASLGDIKGLEVLDVFAGSGALGIEAISRGAKNLVAVEADKNVQQTIANNIEQLGIEHKAKSIRAYFSPWSSKNRNSQFDIVFADPPYNNLRNKDLDRLPRHIKTGGLLILSWPKREEIPQMKTLSIIKHKLYGDAQLVFYRKIV